jgi:hypothetical protein
MSSKMAQSAPQPAFGLAGGLMAIRTACLDSKQSRKLIPFTSNREQFGECRSKPPLGAC